KDYFFELLNLIIDGMEKGVNYTILSGDIHTAGTVEMHLERDGKNHIVPILISSPIAYEPMNFMVEATLREKRVVKMEHANIKLEAINHQFTTNRNFMIIYPQKLIDSPNEAVLLYEEGISG